MTSQQLTNVIRDMLHRQIAEGGYGTKKGAAKRLKTLGLKKRRAPAKRKCVRRKVGASGLKRCAKYKAGDMYGGRCKPGFRKQRNPLTGRMKCLPKKAPVKKGDKRYINPENRRLCDVRYNPITYVNADGKRQCVKYKKVAKKSGKVPPQLSRWMSYVNGIKKNFPDLPYKQILQMASAEYKRGAGY